MNRLLSGATLAFLCVFFALVYCAEGETVELKMDSLTAKSKERMEEIGKKEKTEKSEEAEQEIKALFNQAEALFKEGNYNEAKKIYKRVNVLVEKKKRQEEIEKRKAEKRAGLETKRKERELEIQQKEKEKAVEARQKAMESKYVNPGE